MVLLVMEEGLRHAGLAGVVGELNGPLSLTASRRLQLAAEVSGVTAFLIRRSRRFDDPVLAQPSAAATRWRVASVPSAPPLPDSPDTPGLGPPRWRLDLLRCRGGEPHSWMLEAFDATGRCRVVPDLGDRPPEAPLVTASSDGRRMAVAVADQAALALGIRPGLALAQARAMVPGLLVAEADPKGDAAALERWRPGAFATRR
jgi:protein ImuA